MKKVGATVQYHPTELGFVRRPDLDEDWNQVWEMPNKKTTHWRKDANPIVHHYHAMLEIGLPDYWSHNFIGPKHTPTIE